MEREACGNGVQRGRRGADHGTDKAAAVQQSCRAAYGRLSLAQTWMLDRGAGEQGRLGRAAAGCSARGREREGGTERVSDAKQ